MNRLEIIEDTVKFYSEDTSRRGVDRRGSCSYLTNDGRMCAVGRYLKNPEDAPSSWLVMDIDDLDLRLRPEVRGHNKAFWAGLQRLHDNHNCWDEKGLTPKGALILDEIKEKWCKE